FTITAPNPLPFLSSLAPVSTPAGGGPFTLTVNGNGFVSGAIIRWNGANRPTSLVSATKVTTQISAADIANPGAAVVTVVNPTPGGGVSNSLSFNISGSNSPAPSLVSLSPNSAFAGDIGFTVAITGSGFVSASRVEVNGSQRATTFINSTTLTAEILSADIASPGTLQIAVRTPAPGGGLSGSLPLSVSSLPATLDSINPSRAIAGSAGLTLSVFGKIFFDGAVIRINGSARTTTLVSNYQLTTLLTASDLESPRTLVVTVANPGGAESAPLSLPVYPRVTAVSAASYATGEQARDSILAAFSTNLASGVEVGNSLPLPTALRGTRVVVIDSAGVARDQSLFFVSPQQVNFHRHAETALCAATVIVSINEAIVALGELTVGALAPAIFTQNATGDGVPAAYGLRVSGGSTSVVNLLTFDTALTRWVPVPISPGTASEPVYLALFGTGFRAANGTGAVSVRIGSSSIPVQYVGLSPGFVGLDQLNIGPLPLSLAGGGIQPLVVTINNRIANQSKVIQLAFSAPATASCGTVTDIDGQNYGTAMIGAQCWMSENLRVTRYRDGTNVPLDESGGAAGNAPGETWSPRTVGARTVYANTAGNLTTYGYLYNWHAATDPRGLCPSGWHLPTEAEWTTLTTYLGTNAGGKIRSSGTALWNEPNSGATNESGFSALPGGIRSDRGNFDGLRTVANFWAASRVDGRGALGILVPVNQPAVSSDYHGERSGLHVRCLRN
ncbi:MAG: FISUMP domain-containing protein, partial [Acidobacteriota bacterium]